MHRAVDSFWVSALSSAASSSTAKLRGWLAVAALLLLSGCATFAPSPPEDQTNICEIFREQPSWYDYAQASEEKWGTPIATQMAFIQRESSFRSHVRPDRKYYLGFIWQSGSVFCYWCFYCCIRDDANGVVFSINVDWNQKVFKK